MVVRGQWFVFWLSGFGMIWRKTIHIMWLLAEGALMIESLKQVAWFTALWNMRNDLWVYGLRSQMTRLYIYPVYLMTTTLLLCYTLSGVIFPVLSDSFWKTLANHSGPYPYLFRWFNLWDRPIFGARRLTLGRLLTAMFYPSEVDLVVHILLADII